MRQARYYVFACLPDQPPARLVAVAAESVTKAMQMQPGGLLIGSCSVKLVWRVADEIIRARVRRKEKTCER